MTVRFPASSPLDVMARDPISMAAPKAVRKVLVSRRCDAQKKCVKMSNFCRCPSPEAGHFASVTQKCCVSPAGMESRSPARPKLYREGPPAPVQCSTVYTVHTCALCTVHCALFSAPLCALCTVCGGPVALVR